MDSHIAEVAGLLRYEELADVVLVGHSSAGMLLEGIANLEADRVATLVYLDAYVVPAGQRGYDVWTADQVRQAQENARSGYPFRDPLPPAVLGIESDEMASWVAPRLTPHPLGCFNQPLPTEETRTQTIPRHYIHCTTGPLAQLFASHADAARARGWAISALAAPHDSMLTHPEELASALTTTTCSPVTV